MNVLDTINPLSTILQNVSDMLVYDSEHPLIFASGLFWALFMLFLPIFAWLRRSKWQMMTFMITFSLFFYYKTSGWFMSMLVVTAATDWMLSHAIATSAERWKRRLCLCISLLFSLGVLAYFKYADFFMWNWDMMVQSNYQPLDLVLPIGISFYTFQSASYIIDVYRGKIKRLPSFGEYLFFLSFFPSLVAGPIVRADYFIPQIRANRHASRPEMYAGLWIVIIGVIKKALVADYLAGYCDLVFATPSAYTGFETLMGVAGYVMQIYCDFSGYSDMAIGLALIMGFRLAKNFDFPYKSRNISDFWRRWHISLSSWMRDYVYIPLGGNRKGVVRTYINNFATMMLAGLWHGAGWKFVFWGALHGLGLVVHKACRPWLDSVADTKVVKALSWCITMMFVGITFIFFRAESVHDSLLMLHNIFCDFSPEYILPFIRLRCGWVMILVLIITAHALPSRWWDEVRERFVKSPWLIKLLIFIIAVQLIIQTADNEVHPFIYFRF